MAETTFNIDLDDLFTSLKRRTALKARALGDLDKYSITEDERDWWYDILEDASGKLFRMIASDAQDTDDAYDFDSTTDLEINYIIDTPTYWDDNLSVPFLKQMLSSISKTLSAPHNPTHPFPFLYKILSFPAF